MQAQAFQLCGMQSSNRLDDSTTCCGLFRRKGDVAVRWCAVIKDFGKNVGVDNKQVQGLIRLAKQNGEKLGFLS